MQEINRRDFMKTMGLAAGGLLLSPVLSNKALLPLYTTPHQDLDYDFQLLVNSESNLQVLGPREAAIGTISAEALQTLLKNKPDLSCDTKQSSKSELSRSDLTKGMPEALLPIFEHPIKNLQVLPKNKFSYSSNILVAPALSEADVATPPQIEGVRVGNYYVHASVHSHYLGSCIRRNVVHAGLLVRNLVSNTLTFDLHVAAWWKAGVPCVGIYESVRGFCINPCQYPTWSLLFYCLYTAAAAVLVWYVAQALAAAMAPLSLGLLVAIPGVPPPP